MNGKNVCAYLKSVRKKGWKDSSQCDGIAHHF